MKAARHIDDVALLRQLEHEASMNWALAQRAERDGNRALAETLSAVAAEADRAAMARRKGAAVQY
ncbi:MAG: hypothetical protein R3F55_04930 [Alphaproteobacteria bacterium]